MAAARSRSRRLGHGVPGSLPGALPGASPERPQTLAVGVRRSSKKPSFIDVPWVEGRLVDHMIRSTRDANDGPGRPSAGDDDADGSEKPRGKSGRVPTSAPGEAGEGDDADDYYYSERDDVWYRLGDILEETLTEVTMEDPHVKGLLTTRL